MQTLHVELGERRYPIFIGSQLDPKQLLEPYIHGQQVMIVSNETVAPLYLSHYQEALKSLGKTVATCILPDGEKYKDIQHLNLIFDALLEAGFNRDCTVLALGGGVIGAVDGSLRPAPESRRQQAVGDAMGLVAHRLVGPTPRAVMQAIAAGKEIGAAVEIIDQPHWTNPAGFARLVSRSSILRRLRSSTVDGLTSATAQRRAQ